MRGPGTPLGELVAAAFDTAAQYSSDPAEVSRLATGAVIRMLRRAHERDVGDEDRWEVPPWARWKPLVAPDGRPERRGRNVDLRVAWSR
jgi:hypothetical protein